MRLRILILGLMFVTTSVVSAETTTTQDDSVKIFVQSFYDWYVPLALKPHDSFSYEIVLKQRPEYFSPALRSALKTDLEASQKNPDYIVGLDFDPILASQDPCNHYTPGTAKQVGKNYDVSIFCDGEHDTYVLAEVMQQGSSWVFNNFIYPAHDGLPRDDLLSLLKRLQKSRDKFSK